MPQATADPVADLLMKAPPPLRADAWDAFHTAKNADEFATAIKAMPIADSVKADLWDLKQKQSSAPDFKQSDTSPNQLDPNGLYGRAGAYRGMADTLINALPTLGGAAGGLIGAAGGTVGGMGVGGVPGAIGGATVGGAAGEAGKQIINRLRGAQAPATPADAASSIAGQAAIQGGAEAVGGGAGKILEKGAPWLMQTALKPTLATLKEYQTTAPKLVQTLLEEGINVTQGGLYKLQKLFDATNQEIRDAVSNATGTIKKDAVAARVLPTAGKIAEQTNPTADLKAVGRTVQEFRNHPIIKGDLTVPEAQAMKVGTYQQIGKKYGEMSSASVEAQKALARGLKEEIAAEVPGIGKLNEKDSELMAALDAVGRRVALSGNKDPVGFAWVAAHPTAFIAALFDKNPIVKSMVARGAYESAGAVTKVAPQLIRAAVAALASASPDAPPPQD